MKTLALYLSAMMLFANTYGQKLPNLQNASIRAPIDVKIDGKATEWGEMFQAYNKNTQVYYSISNDNSYLYLAVNTADTIVINKITAGGVMLSLSKSEIKDEENSISVTFPVYEDWLKRPKLTFSNSLLVANKSLKLKIADSLVNSNNIQIISRSKFIKVSNIPSLDEMISIYNNEGIKAAALLNNKMNYSLEIAIPLKLIQPGLKMGSKIKYSITLKGFSNPNSQIYTAPGRSDLLMISPGDGKEYLVGKATPENYEMYTATDFSGEYTLAK